MIEFGRNGWFGVISDEITFENVRIVAQAVADYLNDTSAPGPVALGYDTRFLSREYAWAIQQVLTGNGIRVLLHKKPVPTSFLSLSVRLYGAGLGIMVTGEGRPARFSGLTFRLREGLPASDAWMNSLFNYLYRRYPRRSEGNRHLLQYIDVSREYERLVSKYTDFSLIREKNPRVVSDSFFGSVGTCFQDMMRHHGIDGVHIRTRPNPGFLDCVPQPNGRNIQPVTRLVEQRQGDIGLLFNGDGSRIGAVTSGGTNLPAIRVSALVLEEWIQSGRKAVDLYTELFTPNMAGVLVSRHHLNAKPSYQLYEEDGDPAGAIIWDRNSLTFGAFLPEPDGMLQGILLLQALCRNDRNWEKLTGRLDMPDGAGTMEQKSIHMEGAAWARKRKALLERQGELPLGEVTAVMEEGTELKLSFSDGSWLGFSYNEKESNLFLYYDAPARESMRGGLPAVINRLLQ